jgi:hypothetical protein
MVSIFLYGCDFMSKSGRWAYLAYLEEQEEIKTRERYWEKIFAPARPPAKKKNKS